MKRPAICLLLFLSAAALPARALQQESGEAAEAASLADELKSLEREFSKARSEVFKAMRKLEDAKQGAYYEEHMPDPQAYALRFFDLAERAAGTEVALGAYLWVLQNSFDEENFLISIDVVMRDHIDDEKMTEVCEALMRRPGGVPFLEEILTESRNHDARGNACFALGKRLADSLNWGEAGPEAQEECEDYLERVAAEFADVPVRRSSSTLGDSAKRILFAVRNLVIGKPAPDIEGEDIDGVSFKLSDYRGKVVLLDFWGNW